MIELQLRDMIGSITTFQSLIDQPFRARTAYKLTKIINEINKELKVFEETRDWLLSKYGVKEGNKLKRDKDGNVVIDSDRMNEYNEEVEELFNTTVVLDAEPFEIEELENMNFTYGQMNSIGKFVKE